MHYLITGGAGFIGSHLAEALIGLGDEVTIIDDLSTGSIHNIEHLKAHKNFHYVIDSVMNWNLLSELIDGADMVFHLAAAVGVKLIVESPVRTIETNIKGTEKVLEAAVKKRRKVLIASTSEVYGKADHFPFSEDDDLLLGPTTKGRWSYACSKAIDEFLALAFWKERKLPVIIARLFNTVGPRQTGQYGMVVPRFVNQALRHEPITVYGNGKQRRCFNHVEDTVKALVALAGSPRAVGEIFNVGNNKEISILELAQLVKEMTESRSPIRKIPYDKAYEEGFEDMTRRIPDLRKARRVIGYQPTHSIHEILMDVIADIRPTIRIKK